MNFSIYMATIKNSWQEALETFKPAQLKLLLLVSLRALKNMYNALLRAFFIPLALLIGLVLEIGALVAAFYIVLIARAARPSMFLKRTAYWSDFVLVDWVLFLVMTVLAFCAGLFALWSQSSWLFFILSAAMTVFEKVFFIKTTMWLPGSEQLGALLIFLSPALIIWTFWLLDSKKTVREYAKSLTRALTFCLVNYPFFLVTYLFMRFMISAGFLLAQLFIEKYAYVSVIGWGFLLTVIIPFYVCFLMSFYIKKVHEQFSLYY